jgi:hypothetical protein
LQAEVGNLDIVWADVAFSIGCGSPTPTLHRG